MDPSQQAFHHHLARALMHLNQLAAFLPSFETSTEWDPASGTPRSFPHRHSVHLSRNLHRFVPLPTDARPPSSMVSHGDLPPHFVINPESHFHPVVHRDIQPAVPHSNRGTIYEEFHVVEDLTRPHEGAHPAPRAKQASRSTAPRSVMIPEGTPPARSSKRPRSISMVEHVNRFGSPPRHGASSSLPPPNPTSHGPSGLPPPADRHPTLRPHLHLESDDPEPDRERAPSPTPTVPGYVPSTHIPATESTNPTPNPLDPAIADHRNRPWPPADDRTLIRWKMDSKSRPSWKTIASRMIRTTDSCQARWQWLKNTNSPLLNPEAPDDNQAADD